MVNPLILLACVLLGTIAAWTFNKILVKSRKTPDPKNQPKHSDKKPVDYNEETDKLVNDVISEQYLNRNVNLTSNIDEYNLQYKDYLFILYHNKYVKFQQPESWKYFCKDINGNHVSLTSSADIPKHKFSPATLQKLRDICLQR